MKNFPQHYDKAEHIPKVNAMLKANAGSMNYTYINLHPLFIDAQNRLDAKYTYEGLHLKPEAYIVWVAYLEKMNYL